MDLYTTAGLALAAISSATLIALDIHLNHQDTRARLVHDAHTQHTALTNGDHTLGTHGHYPPTPL